MRGSASHDRLVLAGVAFFFCAHLAWLPRHLEDIDSFNFALGLRDYDIAAHQPHPPGYPVFTFVARVVLGVVSPWTSDAATQAAVAMALLSAMAGACALLALYAALKTLGERGTRQGHEPIEAPALPLLVTALVGAMPLFWVTAARPLSDMPGLAGALGCHALLLRAARTGARAGTQVRDAIIAAAACGLAVGLRSQVTWLVVPLLVWMLWIVWRRIGMRAAIGVGGVALGAVLVWAVPMIILSGGAHAYGVALGEQAGEDLEGVPMLALQPGARRLAIALADTFVSPWGWSAIAGVAIVLALAGVPALRRQPRLATWLVLGFAPYGVYHLLFQETETTRYGLPLVPPVVTLAALALRTWVGRLALPIGLVAGIGLLAVSVQAHRQYVFSGGTISEALAAIEKDARASATRPSLLMHRRVWAETRRARTTLQPWPSYEVLPAPRALEWHEAARVWQRDADAIVWWLIDPRRGDDVAIDPRARSVRRRVGWPSPVAATLGGMRPHPFVWTSFDSPRWVLLDGWGLTPELAGLSAAAGQGPSTRGATALVRPAAGASLVVGGRHIAPPGAATATLEVRIATTWQQSVQVPPGPFVVTWTLPADAWQHGFVPLRVIAADAGSGPERLFLEQFDLQPAGTPVMALESGWYEPERDTASGRRWRWIGDESRLRIAGAPGGVRLSVAGTWPRHYDRAPVLEIFAGQRRIAAHVLPRPFRITQTVTAEQLQGDAGRLTWRVSPSFVAGERTGSADARRLALEIAALDAQALR